jgi:hypothetical protein
MVLNYKIKASFPSSDNREGKMSVLVAPAENEYFQPLPIPQIFPKFGKDDSEGMVR